MAFSIPDKTGIAFILCIHCFNRVIICYPPRLILSSCPESVDCSPLVPISESYPIPLVYTSENEWFGYVFFIGFFISIDFKNGNLVRIFLLHSRRALSLWHALRGLACPPEQTGIVYSNRRHPSIMYFTLSANIILFWPFILFIIRILYLT